MPLPAILLAAFKVLSPFAIAEAQRVAPEIEAEINKILADAAARVNALRATHSVAAIKATGAAQVQAVRDTAEHHVALIQAAIADAVQSASNVLPPLVLPAATLTGPSGATGSA